MLPGVIILHRIVWRVMSLGGRKLEIQEYYMNTGRLAFFSNNSGITAAYGCHPMDISCSSYHTGCQLTI